MIRQIMEAMKGLAGETRPFQSKHRQMLHNNEVTGRNRDDTLLLAELM